MVTTRHDNGTVRQSRRRRRSTDQAVVQRIHELAAIGRTAGEVERQLALDGLDVPAYRTISNIAREARQTAGDTWSLADREDMTSDDAGLVLPVLGELLKLSKWEVRHVTKEEAAWIVRIRRAVPDVPPFESLQLARQYLQREKDGQPTDDLDRVLAWRGWTDPIRRLQGHYGEQGVRPSEGIKRDGRYPPAEDDDEQA